MRTDGNGITLYVQNHFKNLLISIIVFAVGVLCGSLYCVCLPVEETETLRASFTGTNGLLTVQEPLRVFTSAFLSYLQLWILLSLCGTCFLGVLLAPILVGLRGFVCGFCISLLMLLFLNRGIAAATVGLLPQMLLILPAMQMLCAGAAAHVRGMQHLSDHTQRRTQFLSYCMYCVLLLGFFAVAAWYEGYVGWQLLCRILS